MKLYQFNMFVWKTPIEMELFHQMMWDKYPDIIARKRFVCTEEERTAQLINDCAEHNVSIDEIKE